MVKEAECNDGPDDADAQGSGGKVNKKGGLRNGGKSSKGNPFETSLNNIGKDVEVEQAVKLLKKAIADSTRDKDMKKINELEEKIRGLDEKQDKGKQVEAELKAVRDKNLKLKEEVSKMHKESHLRKLQKEKLEKEIQNFIGLAEAAFDSIKTRNDETLKTIGKLETTIGKLKSWRQ